MWNRRKQNALLLIEMFIAFLVLCVLFVYGVNLFRNYSHPLGFQYENLWILNFNSKQGSNYKWTEANKQAISDLKSTLNSIEGVEAVSGIDMIPFSWSNWTSSDSIPGEYISISRSAVDDDLLEAAQLKLLEGRWYQPSDDALPYRPVVINERLAKKMFPNESPLGKTIFPAYPEYLTAEDKAEMQASEGYMPQKIIGVVKDYRYRGELEKPYHFAFIRLNATDSIGSRPPRNFMLRMATANMTGAKQEEIVKAAKSIVPEWTFRMRESKKMHDQRFKEGITPLISFGLVALFLVIMIALGLVGVVWQNVTARIPEIGLRRALGADQSSIFQQIIGELMVLTTISLLMGTLVVIQFPLLEVIPHSYFSWEVYLLGWLCSVVFILLVTFLCGFYPSKMATTIQPTAALHDE